MKSWNEITIELNKDNLIEIADRKKAISKVLDMSHKDDIVIIAGKGHEKYQEIKGKKIPFSDKKIAEDALGELLDD